jgi:hypothetical protein
MWSPNFAQATHRTISMKKHIIDILYSILHQKFGVLFLQCNIRRNTEGKKYCHHFIPQIAPKCWCWEVQILHFYTEYGEVCSPM